MSRRLIALLVGALVVLGVGVTVVVLQVGVGGEPAPSGTAGGSFTEFTSQEAGYAVSYPRSWERVQTDDPLVDLLVGPPGEDGTSLLVRTLPLNQNIGADQLSVVRDFTRQLVQGDGGRSGVEVLSGPNEVEVGGLPGWYYLYRFQDPASARTGAHSHYFLFDGDRMIVLVMQALPASSFQRLAPVFDRIEQSFRTLDG